MHKGKRYGRKNHPRNPCAAEGAEGFSNNKGSAESVTLLLAEIPDRFLQLIRFRIEV